MTTVTMSSKGQLVIPAAMRDQLGLTAGDRLDVRVEDSRIVISAVPDLDELSARISAYARRSGAAPVSDVGEYYQAHRTPRP